MSEARSTPGHRPELAAHVVQRDDGLFEEGMVDPLGPFETRKFAEAVAGESGDPPDKRRRPAAGTAGRYSQDGTSKSNADTKSEILDWQAEKLRRLYSFCRATAYTIAALAFSGGPR
jgi:hypothetical protein